MPEAIQGITSLNVGTVGGKKRQTVNKKRQTVNKKALVRHTKKVKKAYKQFIRLSNKKVGGKFCVKKMDNGVEAVFLRDECEEKETEQKVLPVAQPSVRAVAQMNAKTYGDLNTVGRLEIKQPTIPEERSLKRSVYRRGSTVPSPPTPPPPPPRRGSTHTRNRHASTLTTGPPEGFYHNTPLDAPVSIAIPPRSPSSSRSSSSRSPSSRSPIPSPSSVGSINRSLKQQQMPGYERALPTARPARPVEFIKVDDKDDPHHCYGEKHGYKKLYRKDQCKNDNSGSWQTGKWNWDKDYYPSETDPDKRGECRPEFRMCSDYGFTSNKPKSASHSSPAKSSSSSASASHASPAKSSSASHSPSKSSSSHASPAKSSSSSSSASHSTKTLKQKSVSASVAAAAAAASAERKRKVIEAQNKIREIGKNVKGENYDALTAEIRELQKIIRDNKSIKKNSKTYKNEKGNKFKKVTTDDDIFLNRHYLEKNPNAQGKSDDDVIPGTGTTNQNPSSIKLPVPFKV